MKFFAGGTYTTGGFFSWPLTGGCSLGTSIGLVLNLRSIPNIQYRLKIAFYPLRQHGKLSGGYRNDYHRTK